MAKVRYVVEIETSANEEQIRNVDRALAGEIHNQFALCPSSSRAQVAHLFRIDNSNMEMVGRGNWVGETKYHEIKFDPTLADCEAPADYISPVGATKEGRGVD